MVLEPRSGMACKTPNVHFIDDSPGRGVSERRVPIPIISGRIYHHAFHRRRAIVSRSTGGFAAVIPGNCYTAAIRIEQELRGIEAHPFLRLEGPMDPITVKLAWAKSRYERVPIVIGAVCIGA
jgi:hypothetical protein